MTRKASIRFNDDDWAWLEKQCLNGECGLSEIMRRALHRLRQTGWNTETVSLNNSEPEKTNPICGHAGCKNEEWHLHLKKSKEEPRKVLEVRVSEPEKFLVTE